MPSTGLHLIRVVFGFVCSVAGFSVAAFWFGCVCFVWVFVVVEFVVFLF